jgi:RNA polymerase sigma-70 factor, ECF subfamily
MLAEREAWMQNPDEQLVARCHAGDLDAFGQIYARYEQQVFRYAYHLLGHKEDADDVKQETFVRAYQAIGKFRHDASVPTWLLKICGNLCRDRFKSWEQRKVEYHAEYRHDLVCPHSHGNDPQTIVERAERMEIVLRALHSMPLSQREIIVLHDIEERDYKEIGAILGCTPISAKLRLFRARRSLQERVKSMLG